MLDENNPKQLIRQQKMSVYVKLNNNNEKFVIANVPSQNSKTHFGKITVDAMLQTQQRVRDQKKDKFQMQTLKMEITSQIKNTKVFNLSLPVNRGVKKSGDSKLHFILQISDNKALMTFVDDYAQCGMRIKGKAPQLSIKEAFQLQRKKLDKRRKSSAEGQVLEDHQDPDFQGQEQQEND